ncbi:unnamed protein product, partial [Symbiodinium necroappetens]
MQRPAGLLGFGLATAGRLALCELRWGALTATGFQELAATPTCFADVIIASGSTCV